MIQRSSSIQTTITPWLTVPNGAKAANFYKAAFDAVETYRLETPDGLIVKLSLNGAEFWLSGGGSENNDANVQPVGGGTVRMILTVDNPDALFKKALEAGSSEVFPIGEGHGWRLGRLVDPFGLHWEIGHPVS
ncbi:MAG: VOC family protein [Chitinophagales bacterium]